MGAALENRVPGPSPLVTEEKTQKETQEKETRYVQTLREEEERVVLGRGACLTH